MIKLIKDIGMQYATQNSKTKTRFGIYECPYCKKHFKANMYDVNFGKIVSCGCRKKMKDLSIEINGFKVVKDLKQFDKNNQRIAIFECKHCKNEFVTRVYNIKSGKQKSCGCLPKHKTHGMSNTRLYSIWIGMIKRTTKSNRKDKKYYFDKNIKVCKEWKESFENFKEWALRNRYNENLTIDRIDSNKGYEPSNCRFVDYHIQSVNKSSFKMNKFGYKGVSKIKNKYIARIMINGKRIQIGRFNTAKEAAIAYDNYIIKNNLTEYKTNKELGWL